MTRLPWRYVVYTAAVLLPLAPMAASSKEALAWALLWLIVTAHIVVLVVFGDELE